MADFLIVFVSLLIDIISFAIIARVLLSWFPGAGAGSIKSILYDVTEPILGPFKKLIPRMGMIDISPIIALIALDLIRTILLSIIYNFVA